MMQLSLHLAPVLWCMLNELWFNARQLHSCRHLKSSFDGA